MAHHKSAQKRIRSSEMRRLRNRQNRKKLKTLTQSVRNAETKEHAAESLAKAMPFLDKAVAKKIIHRNKAARQKSALTKFVKNL
jgi:small subunit ribosomal protein S20